MKFPAYIITLLPTSERVTALASLLDDFGFDAKVITAVLGAELDAVAYYFAIQTYLAKRKKLISPSEVGCALSHKIALSDIVSSGVGAALVLEDDVELDESSLEDLQNALGSGFPERDSIFHVGRQQSLHTTSTVRAEVLQLGPKIYRVCNKDLYKVHGAFGYVVTREVAVTISELLADHIFLIDDFDYMLGNNCFKSFCFSGLVRHPMSNDGSSIQKERQVRPVSTDADLSLLLRLRREIGKTLHYRRSNLVKRLSARKACYLDVD